METMTTKQIRDFILEKYGYNEFTIPDVIDALKRENKQVSYMQVREAISDLDEDKENYRPFAKFHSNSKRT